MGQGEQAGEPMGEQLTVGQAIENLVGPDTGLRFYAAWWLGRFKVQDELGFERLIAALGDEDDRTAEGGYPLRRNAARALGKIGAGWTVGERHVGERAVLPLIGCLDCEDFYVREAAAQSLEMLGDERAVPRLMAMLRLGVEGDGLKVGADLAEPFDAYLEALGTVASASLSHRGDASLSHRGASDVSSLASTSLAERSRSELVDLIARFLEHPIGRTQYAADRAMYQLTGDDRYGQLLVEALRGDDLQLRRAALTDVGAIGYLPAAEAIAATLAENSLKLIALKGVLEQQVVSADAQPPIAGGTAQPPIAGGMAQPPIAGGTVAERQPKPPIKGLSVGAVRVMDLMDGLL